MVEKELFNFLSKRKVYQYPCRFITSKNRFDKLINMSVAAWTTLLFLRRHAPNVVATTIQNKK